MEKEKAKELLLEMASHLKAVQDIMKQINKDNYDKNAKQWVGDLVVGASVNDNEVDVHITNIQSAEAKVLEEFTHIKSLELTQKKARNCDVYPWEFSKVIDGVKFFCLEENDEE